MRPRNFDIGDAVTFFFKRFGENPGGALWLMICQIALLAGVGALTLYFLGPFYLGLFELVEADLNHRLSEAEERRLFLEMITPFFTVIPLMVLVGIASTLMIQGAWQRFLTRGEVKPVIPFRFGGDEIRLLGVALLFIGLGIVASFGVSFVFALFGGASVFLIAASDGAPGAVAGAGGVMAIAGLVIAAAAIFIAVRLAPAAPLTVHDGKLRFFEAWSATQGRFWPMLFSYVLVFVIFSVVGSALGFVFYVLMFAPFLPMILELDGLSHRAAEIAPSEVFDVVFGHVAQPGVFIPFLIGVLGLALLRIALEAMISGVAAYAAVTHRDANPDEEGDAPKLDAGHPAGASPSQG